MTAGFPDTLLALGGLLHEGGPPLAAHVDEPGGGPIFAPLPASGPRAAAAPGEYALVVEAVREGYLLHYGRPRLLSGHDADLALLAGDYLYALGIERLAALGDLAAVGELGELIADCAQLHAEGRGEDAAARWDTAARAIGGVK